MRVYGSDAVARRGARARGRRVGASRCTRACPTAACTSCSAVRHELARSARGRAGAPHARAAARRARFDRDRARRGSPDGAAARSRRRVGARAGRSVSGAGARLPAAGHSPRDPREIGVDWEGARRASLSCPEAEQPTPACAAPRAATVCMAVSIRLYPARIRSNQLIGWLAPALLYRSAPRGGIQDGCACSSGDRRARDGNRNGRSGFRRAVEDRLQRLAGLGRLGDRASRRAGSRKPASTSSSSGSTTSPSMEAFAAGKVDAVADDQRRRAGDRSARRAER